MISFILAVALNATTVPTISSPADLDALRSERIELLEEILRMSEQMYASGDTRIGVMMSAQQDLLAAKLEAADSPEARLRILTEQVEVATKWEEIVRAQVEQGVSTKFDLYKARSSRLGYAIELAKQRDSMGEDQ